MKFNRLTKTATLLLIAAVALTGITADAQARKLSAAKRQVKTTQAIKSDEKSLQNGTTTVTIMHYDSPAYYKVPKSEAGYSSGYCDNSFSIDWPTATTTGNITQLQQWMLNTFSNSDPPAKTVSALIKWRNLCEYSGARRVNSIPHSDDESNLSDKGDITVKLLTPDILMFDYHGEMYTGGGTGASYMYGDGFYYYNLSQDRELKSEDLFTPQVANAIVQQLRQDEETWDCLWDDFKESPHATDNFSIERDKVVFVYSKYEIAPGMAGNVEAEVPIELVMPYATPAFKAIVAAME